MFFLGFSRVLESLHYNNPSLVEGVADTGGIRVYYTSKLRQHEVGLFAMGDITGPYSGVPIGNGIVQHVHECPSSCSLLTLSKKVTILRVVFHAHNVAVSMKLEIIRNSKVRQIERVDFFVAVQQGAHRVQAPPFSLEPGDSLRLTCTYRSHTDVVWGGGAEKEMCQVTLGAFI